MIPTSTRNLKNQNLRQIKGERDSTGVSSRGQQRITTNPFWTAARGSLLLRTRIMMMEKRKKKQAIAKHMRYTDL